jgi:diguanylate cyclase (GGDEF)-like protein
MSISSLLGKLTISTLTYSTRRLPRGRKLSRRTAKMPQARVVTGDDQAAPEAHRYAADVDQMASTIDQASADADQRASDRDQAAADRDESGKPDAIRARHVAYDTSRKEREASSAERDNSRRMREIGTRDRNATAVDRDRRPRGRDSAADAGYAGASRLKSIFVESERSVTEQLQMLSVQAAADRVRAASDRARAASDLAHAARERERLETELRAAHLDDLTGAYRREVGELALSNEIERARRADGRFVIAFVDVDGLKLVNDRDGHAAGDRILRTVVDAIRMRLRPFDPIVRYGGDEFVCGLSGTDLLQAKGRFDAIGIAIESETRVSISVGLAALAPGETAGQLTDRADTAMLEVKAGHHSRQ